MQTLKREGFLAESLNHSNPSDVLYGSITYILQRCLVVLHQFLCLVAAGSHPIHQERNDNSYKGCQAKSPINDEHQHQHDHRRYKSRNHVGKVVGDESFQAFNVIIHDLPQLTAAHLQMVVQSAVCASDAQSVRSVSVFHPCFSPLPHSCPEAFPAHAPADAPI